MSVPMSGKPWTRILSVVMLLVSIAAVTAVAAQSGNDDTPEANPMVFEVAEDGTRFAFGTERLHEDGMPAYGSPFVTQGYIYPVGTLNGTNGVLENGEPEFPDQVLGEWVCYGWMIGDGGHTTTGEWVVSTQVYKFNDGSTIITDGFELVDIDVPFARAVTGGTGAYTGVSGDMTQVLHGFTAQMGVNLTVEFHLDDAEAA